MRILPTWRGVMAAAVVAAGLYGATAATASAAFPSGPFPPGPQSAVLYVNNGPMAPGHGQIWWNGQWGGWQGGRWFTRPDSSCANAAYTTIGAAVAAAAPGSQIVVCPGVYDEGVLIDKQLTLTGDNGAVIDASSSPFGNGVQITGPGGSGSTVQGFKIENALLEGILVGTAPIAPTRPTVRP